MARKSLFAILVGSHDFVVFERNIRSWSRTYKVIKRHDMTRGNNQHPHILAVLVSIYLVHAFLSKTYVGRLIVLRHFDPSELPHNFRIIQPKI
jgi:hypothetical protein